MFFNITINIINKIVGQILMKMLSTIYVFFLMIQLSFQRTKLYIDIDYTKPKIIEEELDVGDTIDITYNEQNSFIINIGKPKFYMNIEYNNFKYHSLSPGIYVLGNKGHAYYTALEAGKHKFLAWSTSATHCMHLIAYGKQNHIKTRPINPKPFVFVETDPNVKMTVQADKLISGDWVHPFIDGQFADYGVTSPPFNLEVDCLVKVNQVNSRAVNVAIDSNGNTEFDYGEYDASELAVSPNMPFVYTAENKKENVLNDFYDPSEQLPPDHSTNTGSSTTSTESSNSESTTTNDSGSSGSTSTRTDSSSDNAQNPGNGDDNSEENEDDGLSTGAWAGIGTGIAAGVGGIVGTAVGVYKKVKSNITGSEGEDDGKNVNKNTNNINNNNNITLNLNI